MILFSGYKGRSVFDGKRVKVYRNLNISLVDGDLMLIGGPVYSVQDAKSRLVLGHSQCVLLHDATFQVSQKGRQRVLESGQKNVHAFVTGEWGHGPSERELRRIHDKWSRAFYDPWAVDQFVNVNTKEPVLRADTVVIGPSGVYYQ